MARAIRIVILLFVLATVAQQTILSHSHATNWTDPLRVTIYPINGDGSPATQNYLNGLDRDIFLPIESYLATECKRHGRNIHRPIRLTIAPELHRLPPVLSAQPDPLEIIFWSLHMRWWAWRNDGGAVNDKPQVRLYVLFFDPSHHRMLPHSTGLERAMIGLVNAFATGQMAGSNNVVITHELMHALGATDKYDLATNQPIYPYGYADPLRTPRFPQDHAEIMGGRIAKSATYAEIPESLENTIIGPLTAAEIGLIKAP